MHDIRIAIGSSLLQCVSSPSYGQANAEAWFLSHQCPRGASRSCVRRARNRVATYRMGGRTRRQINGMSTMSISCRFFSHETYRWLYTLYLSVDANFKLRLKDRGARDVYLGPGWAYVVEETKYKEHIKKFANTKEVCSFVCR